MTVTLGGVAIKSAAEAPERFSMLLWGQAKSGKTTLAATAPGKKLWINFDPDGTASLLGRDDIMLADFSQEKPHVIIPKLLNDDPVGLGALLDSDKDIGTVVLDSITFLAPLVQDHACKSKGLTIEEPGKRGYGVKNNWLNKIVRDIARVVKERNRNFIITAHEAAPDKDDKGNITGIGLALSDSIAVGLSALPSEIWHVRASGAERWIAILPCRQRSPMGTRMFLADGEPEFRWRFDPVSRKGQTIEEWFTAWQQRGGKIPVPSN